jgi:hypothetical protein
MDQQENENPPPAIRAALRHRSWQVIPGESIDIAVLVENRGEEAQTHSDEVKVITST